jgi:hypothetical protein
LEGQRATGLVLENGLVLDGDIVVSNADPKRTFLKLVAPEHLDPGFIQQVKAIYMNGPSAKVNLVLNEVPRVNGMPKDAPPLQRMLYTLVPTYDQAQACYNPRRWRNRTRLWVDCIEASIDRPRHPRPSCSPASYMRAYHWQAMG